MPGLGLGGALARAMLRPTLGIRGRTHAYTHFFTRENIELFDQYNILFTRLYYHKLITS
jgi:hypothetical protein